MSTYITYNKVKVTILLVLYIGFGVVTTKIFKRGEFLLEYVGERISPKDAQERMALGIKKGEDRFYIFHYKFQEKNMW